MVGKGIFTRRGPNPQRRRSPRKLCGLPMPQNAATFWRLDFRRWEGPRHSCVRPPANSVRLRKTLACGLTFYHLFQCFRTGPNPSVLSPPSGRVARLKAVHAVGRPATGANSEMVCVASSATKSSSRAKRQMLEPVVKNVRVHLESVFRQLTAAKAVRAEDHWELRNIRATMLARRRLLEP